MRTRTYNLRKSVLTLAILLVAAVSAQAQFSWSGTQTLSDGDNITQNITLVGDVTINVASGTATLSGTLSGAGSLTKTGNGALVLTANNTYTGATTVSRGALQLGNGGTAGSVAGSIAIAKMGRSAGGTITRGGTLIVNRSNDLQITNVISNSTGTGNSDGGIIKRGTGTLMLYGNNTYTGMTMVEEGKLNIGGTAGAIVSNINVALGATVQFRHTKDYTYGGVISGAGNVEKIYEGNLILTGRHTFTGKITVNGNTQGKMTYLRLADGSSIASVSEVELVTAGQSELVFDCTSGDVTFNVPITGAGNVQKLGGRSVWITAQPQYTGHTAIVEGAVCFITSALPTSRIYFVSGAAHTVQIEVPEGQTLEYNKRINEDSNGAAPGNLIKSGAGKLILSAENTYTGATTVYGGTLQIGNETSGSIATTSDVSLETPASVLRFEPGENMTFSKVISGSGRVEYKGSVIKELSLNAINTYTGSTTIESGQLCIGGTAGTIAGDIINNGSLHFSRSQEYTYSGVISGTGSVHKFGLRPVTLNGANTYTGETFISTNTLVLGVNGTIAASSGVTMLNSAVKLDISAGNKTIKSLNSNFGNTEIILGTRRLAIGTQNLTDGGGTYAGKISGTGILYKYGKQKLTLTGTESTYTGATYIFNGEVEFAAGSFNSASSAEIFLYADATLTWGASNSEDISSRLYLVQVGNHTLKTGGQDVQFQSTVGMNTTPKVTKVGAGRIIIFAKQTWPAGTDILEGAIDMAGTVGSLTGNVFVAEGATLQCTRSTELVFPGIISGLGNVSNSNGKLILTGNNTFRGTLTANADVQIGNGGTTGGIVSNVALASGKRLSFNRSNDYTYAGVVSGTAGAGIDHNGTGKLILNGINTYSGDTYVNAAGTLELGASGTISSSSGVWLAAANAKFRITSDKTISNLTGVSQAQAMLDGGMLTIALKANRANDAPISGIGGLTILGGSSASNYTYTLNGAHTYIGTTTVIRGTLLLGSNGSLASENIILDGTGSYFGKLDVSSGSKTLKNLSANYSGNEVILGGNTLQIGTSAFTGDGGGAFKGKFSGTGGVAKTGLALLALSGANTATGSLSHSSGTIEFMGSWAGNYYQSGGVKLDVTGNTAVGGNLTLTGGGTISMDMTAEPPAKINVTGMVSTSGTTTMDVAATEGDYTLIESASGINNLSHFTFPQINGLTLTPMLGADDSKTQLKLHVVVSDLTPPVPTPSTIDAASVTAQSLILNWTVATDDMSPASNLRYFVYQSASDNIDNVADCEANGTLLNPGGTLNINTHAVSGLNPNTAYYFNLVVVDAAGNKAAYTSKTATTFKATLEGTVFVVRGIYTYSEEMIVDTRNLTSTPAIADLGEVTYLWRRNGTETVGGNSPSYTFVEADINNTITVIISTANTQGSISLTTTEIQKQSQGAPDAPTLASRTHNSITLTDVAGCEYRMNGGEWQTSATFEGLTPETQYEFEARLAETATRFASPVSVVAQISTDVVAVYGISLSQTLPYSFANLTMGYSSPAYKSVTVTNTGNQPTGMLSITLSGSHASSFTVSPASINNVEAGATSQFYVQPKSRLAADTHSATVTISGANGISASFDISVTVIKKDAPSAPSAPTVESKSHNSVTLTPNELYEFQMNTNGWQASNEFVGLTANTAYTFYQRIKETDDTEASASSAGTTETTNLTPAYGITLDPATNKTFDAATVGYDAQTPHSVVINNPNNQATGALTITLTGTNASSFSLNKGAVESIEPDASDEFTVVPNIGLEVGTYTATVTVFGDNGISESFDVSFTVKSIPTLTGTATIDNTTPRIDDILTASLVGSNNTGTLSYQWKVDGINVGTNSATYTVLLADLGKTIVVEITSSVETGVCASAPTAAINKKVAPDAPGAPNVERKTHNSVMLAAITGAEYRMNGGAWQTSTLFDGLEPETQYSFEARIAETATRLASPVSAATNVTTDAPQATPRVNSVTVSPSAITLIRGAEQQFSVYVETEGGASDLVDWRVSGNDNGTTISEDGLLTISENEPAGTINVTATSRFDNSKYGTAIVTVEIIKTGIDIATFSELSIYPNPCKDMVTIDNAEGAYLKIVDMAGKTIRGEKIISDSRQISVVDLPKGVYMFQLMKDGNTETVKIIKK